MSDYASALAAAEPDTFLNLEGEAGKDARFAALDRLVANVLSAALAGHRPVAVVPGEQGINNSDALTLSTLTPQERSLVQEAHSLSVQRGRGAWYLAEQLSLKAGVLNLPAYLRHHPWHAITLAGEDAARVHLGATPDALAAWSLLIPLFDDLLAPITVRASGSAKPAAEQEETWAMIAQMYASMGLTAELEPFAYGRGWSRLDRAGQARARIGLLDALGRADPLRTAARFRAARVQELVSATLKKGRGQTPPARKVLTKALQPALSAYFGGDWPAYLEYVELPQNPAEKIVTALPTAARATQVPAVERRAEVLRRWWGQFDAVHARQVPGMHALWGLIEDGPYTIKTGFGPIRQLYRWILSPDLVEEVNTLWDGVTLPRWPETIVSEPYPHRLMAETLGPAGEFWHGVALTVWFVREGPTSRTTVPGLRGHYRRVLTELEQAGTPIHPSLFDELEHARGGFEPLRDIITRHRQGWSNRYFEEYLRHRWQSELSGVSYEHDKFAAANGRAPTYQQFARFAAKAANHWFNGDLTGVYAAIGEPAPAASRRVDLLPGSAHDFVDALYAALGGLPFDEAMGAPLADLCRQQAELAAAGLSYLQLAEALGRVPEAKEFGVERHEWDWAGGVERGWPAYRRAVEKVVRS